LYDIFITFQDTVVALQALSDFAAMAYSDSFDIQATITADNMTHTFSINKQNSLVLQTLVVRNTYMQLNQKTYTFIV